MSTGILIGNLGTPASYSTTDVKIYLKQFLMDPYVIDKPWWFRWPLVHGIIVPFRASKSAHAYESVWMKEGSPLLVYSRELVAQLQKQMGPDYKVALGMRYGTPSVEEAFRELAGCSQIVLAPQYPQYALSSTETWLQEALSVVKKMNWQKPLYYLEPFYAREQYLSSLEKHLRHHLASVEHDHILFSFHGLPERHLKVLDPSGQECLVKSNCCDQITANNQRCYRAQCYAVVREMGKRLQLPKDKYSVAFQSRLGRDPWIQPFTDHVLPALPGRGFKKLVMAMPSFTVDCLETLEEIQIRAKEDYLRAGGQSFYAVPCLNADPFWVAQLSALLVDTHHSPQALCQLK